jgi:L-arabinose isomerase
MTMAFDGLRIWFLTGSQDLYGEAILAQVSEQSATLVAGLGSADDVPVEIVHKPTVTTPDGIRRACLDATSDDTCIGVIGWMHTFSPAKMWIAGLQALGKPFLHLHTQYGRDLPYAEIDMTFMNLNQSAHGDREFAYIVSRLRMPRKTVAGHWQDRAVQARVGAWMRAAVGLHEARTLKVVRFGDNMREVADTDGDKVEVQARLGVSCNTHPVNELVDVVGQVADADVDRLCIEYDEAYDVVAELRPGGDRRESLRDAARIELGLRAFLTDGGFGAFVDTFQDLGGLRQLPGIGAQRLMADGYGFGAEGDWKSSALVRIVKAMSQGLDGGVSFMEDYTYDFGAASPAVLGAHMLEVCPSIAAGTPSCEIHPLFVGEREDPVRLVFTGAAGPGVVVGMVDMGTHLRLVANEIDAIQPPAELPRLPVARALWVPRPDFATSAESWLLAGGPHHTAYSQAVGLEVIEDFAEMAGVELVAIDAATDAREFKRELRQSQAYWHLAGGL